MAYSCLVSRISRFPARLSVIPTVVGSYARSIHDSTSDINATKFASEEDLPVTLEKNPFETERRLCILCRLDINPDYKNVRLLSQFQSRYTGRIYGRHITGLCKNKQQMVEYEITKAQSAGLMGYYTKNMSYANDPKLFDPDHPFRPHKY